MIDGKVGMSVTEWDDPYPGSSLALLRIPFVFTQDDLLTTDKFIARAKERGYAIDLDLLQQLHEHRLLVPLFRVSDTPVRGRRIDVDASGGANARGWVLHAAADGRLRDPADEGYSIAWPYRKPPDTEHRWWNGFVYSSWQLFDLRHVIDEYRFIKAGWHAGPYLPRTERDRRLTLVLVALAPRYLPGVLGRLSFPPDVEEDQLRRFRAEAEVQELLRQGGFAAADLQQTADALLLYAHSDDPMDKWLEAAPLRQLRRLVEDPRHAPGLHVAPGRRQGPAARTRISSPLASSSRYQT